MGATQALSNLHPRSFFVRNCRRWLWKTIAACVVLESLVLLLIMLGYFVAPPTTPLMLLRSMEGYKVQYDWVGFHSIAPVMRRAVIGSEDVGFCHEPTGFDFAAIKSQLKIWYKGGRPRGASTITMQTARNLFLLPNRAWLRKLLELWITPQIAVLWSRQRILEVYLNIAEFGPGIHGVQAASRYYFGKNASDLTLQQATHLCLSLPQPLSWSVTKPPPIDTPRALKVEVRASYAAPGRFSCIDEAVSKRPPQSAALQLVDQH